MRFFKEETKLIWRHNGEIVCIQPWGKDSLRIRAIKGKDVVDNLPGALLKAKIFEEGKIGLYNSKDKRLLTE